MPIYEYECSECGRIEVVQKVTDKPLKCCPECEEKGRASKVERVISAAAFHLKGSGWYKTDYASTSGSAGTKNTKKASTSSESTSESSTKSEEKTETKKDKKPGGGGGCGSGCGCH